MPRLRHLLRQRVSRMADNSATLAAYYKDSYGECAKLPDGAAAIWLNRAKIHLSRITGRKSDASQSDLVKRCICEMAECLYSASLRDGITAENNDGYSIKYANGDIKKSLYSIADTYLAGTDILYRGDVVEM